MPIIPLHINGPARVEITSFPEELNPVGAEVGQFGSIVGFTAEGVDIAVQIGTREWMTDQSGSLVPGAILFTGFFADIDLDLIRWNQRIVDRLLKIIYGIGVGGLPNSNTALIGRHIFSAERTDDEEDTAGVDRTASIRIISEKLTGLPREPSYEFKNCYLTGSQEFRLGRRITRMQIKFRCLAQDQVSEGRVYDKL